MQTSAVGTNGQTIPHPDAEPTLTGARIASLTCTGHKASPSQMARSGTKNVLLPPRPTVILSNFTQDSS